MKKELLAILLGYFDTQKGIFDRIIKDIEATQATDKEKTSHLAYLLHNLYCALEELFQEVAKTFENRIEDPSRFHRELLKRMRLEIPNIRPKLLSEGCCFILDEMRGFRHVFRHSYDYELSPARVEDLKNRVVAGWDKIQTDLKVFEDFLKACISNFNERL